MENQNRVLTFSEFTKTYAKGDKFSAPGNNEENVRKIKDATNSLELPTVGPTSPEMDSVSSLPASKKVKTDYELSPPTPNGPVKMNDLQNSVDKQVEDEKIMKSDKPVKSLKKTKKIAKKSKEDEREELGDY
jgi:hypothetical protein